MGDRGEPQAGQVLSPSGRSCTTTSRSYLEVSTLRFPLRGLLRPAGAPSSGSAPSACPSASLKIRGSWSCVASELGPHIARACLLYCSTMRSSMERYASICLWARARSEAMRSLSDSSSSTLPASTRSRSACAVRAASRSASMAASSS